MRPNGCQSNRVSESSNWSIKIPNILSLAKWFVYRKRFQSSTSHKCLKNGRFSDENILILRNRRSIEWDSRAKYERECGASKKRCVTKVKLYPDNFEITRRAGITHTGFCMIHWPVYFDLPVQPANPLISHFRLAQCFSLYTATRFAYNPRELITRICMLKKATRHYNRALKNLSIFTGRAQPVNDTFFLF